ncbi:hypothetical protein LTR37_016874 [Vermiconidia calcicola]|uniref:Uncharacterized protein n=1 Tax=Vermiconidia calcicola TaxID=1690605 RepID=A0ACC3MN71_9PEZI|nr:hypothetical protein LTR37_016874 [Vermiconidia calcicola]
MCWSFADAWLENPEEPAKTEVWEYVPLTPAKKKRCKARVVEDPGRQRAVVTRTVEHPEEQKKQTNAWEYVPAPVSKNFGKAPAVVGATGRSVDPPVAKEGRNQGQKKEQAKAKKKSQKKDDNMWQYAPAPSPKTSNEPSKAKQLAALLYQFRFLQQHFHFPPNSKTHPSPTLHD